MKQDDIEKLLQQYGADRRQQQHAATNLRHMAHKAKLRAGLVCAILTLSTVAGILLWSPLETEGTLVAEHNTVVQSSEKQQAMTVPNSQPISKKSTESPSTKTFTNHATNHTQHLIQPKTQTINEPLLAEIQEATSITGNENNNENENGKNILANDNNAFEVISGLPPTLTISEPDHSYYQLTPEKESRFHFTATIGAAATPGEVSETTNYPSSPNNANPTVNTTASFSANAGVTFTIAYTERSHFDIGIALSGHTQQGSVFLPSTTIEGWGVDNTPIGLTLEERNVSFNTYSLYASIPLVLNMSPLGAYKTGWMLSLTPAHIIASTKMINALQNQFNLNPWKLTLGAGLTFPKRHIGRVCLTANLLPLYTSKSIHEFGIEIGF